MTGQTPFRLAAAFGLLIAFQAPPARAQGEDMCKTMGHGCPTPELKTESSPLPSDPAARGKEPVEAAEDEKAPEGVNPLVFNMLSQKSFVPENNSAAGLKHTMGASGALPRTGGPGSLLRPSAPCASNPANNCYPPEQLRQIAEVIGGKWEDLNEVASQVITRPSKAEAGDVGFRDLKPVLGYLGDQQTQIDRIEKAAGKSWAEIKNSDAKLKQVIRSAPREERQAIREKFEDLKAQHQRLSDGPFHEALMGAKGSLAERLIHDSGMAAGGSGGMTGGQWAGAQPKNPAAHTYAANEALQNGDAAAAAEWARNALKLDPSNPAAHTALAAALYDQKDFSGARDEAQQALALDPNDAKAAAVLSLAHDTKAAGVNVPKAGEPQQQASSAFTPAAAPWRKLDVGDEREAQARDAARRAERLLSSGDYAGAKEAADRALAAYPHSAYAFGLRSMANLKAGNLDAALKDAVAGLALNPNDRMAQKARAQALLKLGRNEEALRAARAAVAGDPRSGYARYLLAEAHEANGDRRGALQALAEAAGLDPRYREIHEAALKVSEDGDMAFLFPDLKPGALKAAAGSAAPARGKRFLAVAAGAAAGGGLLAWLGWQLFGASLAPALRTVFTRRAAPSSGGAAAPSAAAPRDPELLRGQYRTLRQIGVGGMGLVFEGDDVSLGRKVAIKRMRDELRLDRRQRERFVSEARMVAALHHPNIVDIYSIVDEGEDLFLIFEYVKGQTMYELIHQRGGYSFAEALTIFRGVSSALEYAHARNIIHRDLKPSNIMINHEGLPKVMDFGIARAAKDAMTRYSMTNTVVGTPPYMAPEQEQGVVRKESDVYALAICFYESVTGKLPFSGSGGGMLMNKINKAYTPASKHVAGLPEGLDEVFAKALEPNPDDRYRSVAELRVALEALPVAQAA